MSKICSEIEADEMVAVFPGLVMGLEVSNLETKIHFPNLCLGIHKGAVLMRLGNWRCRVRRLSRKERPRRKSRITNKAKYVGESGITINYTWLSIRSIAGVVNSLLSSRHTIKNARAPCRPAERPSNANQCISAERLTHAKEQVG
jgi:hypothetical protein